MTKELEMALIMINECVLSSLIFLDVCVCVCVCELCSPSISPLDALDMEENNKRNESIGSNGSKNGVKEISRTIPMNPGNVVNLEREKITPPSVTNEHTIGEVNMEAYVTPDDVIRAGGFGARDDISSFLPVASDSTDFEATLVDARTYEDAKGEISRPGLGWREATTKGDEQEIE
ncbi:hypothetical protein K2173_025174 [Erythroxylum novogranatense]|uniref:Uncharacterized protein n=1 Tax=Erythroxylum novogranatense TaxID=1862640 RepID=A0AAV8SVT8_9ROSI|nr:hypothetical protein K2173_025174 [Erythroxylum novogranatense]